MKVSENGYTGLAVEAKVRPDLLRPCDTERDGDQPVPVPSVDSVS